MNPFPVSPLQYPFNQYVIKFLSTKTVTNKPPMAYKRLIVIFFFGFLHVAFSQPNCVIQTRYMNDGLTVKYIPAVTIDSSATETCGLGIEMANASNYVTLSFSSNGSPKQIKGDLILMFTDKSELRIPHALVNLSRVRGKQVTLYTYYILEKFINQLITKPIETVSYELVTGEIKTIPIKSDNSLLLKSGLMCLNPLL